MLPHSKETNVPTGTRNECNKERNEQAYGKSTTEDVLFSKRKPKIDSVAADPWVWRQSMVDSV